MYYIWDFLICLAILNAIVLVANVYHGRTDKNEMTLSSKVNKTKWHTVILIGNHYCKKGESPETRNQL